MPDGSGVIRPRAVPLTHIGQQAAHRPSGRNWLLYLAAGLACALVIALFIVLPDFIEPIAVAPPAKPTEQLESAAATSPSQADALPPFQALRQEQARTEASNALVHFVELELKLGDEVHINAWGQADYISATNLAQTGDDAFVGERFDESITLYQQAAAVLATLIETGHNRFDEALTAAIAAIDARELNSARSHLDEAGKIRPDDPALLAATARAGRLPEVITQFRQARNHELAGRWAEAVQTYEGIRALDAQTPGLATAIAAATRSRSAQQLRNDLSAGFSALERRQFEASKRAFNQALKIDPGNTSAQGGLQQIAEQSVSVQIERLQRQAKEFEAAEQWREAAAAHSNILALDRNIQFASNGLSRANAQAQALQDLTAIRAAPEELSSNSLYQAALATLEQVKDLSPMGPLLHTAVAETKTLLQHYGRPVGVVLHSDNQTEVLLSNIGELGRFAEKHLRLRPGTYTLIGSRDGCRDVRLRIRVTPDMAPVDIRCREVLQQ